MSETTRAGGGWVMPVLLAIATSAALGMAFLYVVRPGAGELGTVRVVVSDEKGNAGDSIQVVVAEAPLVQKDVVTPGPKFTGIVRYAQPYLIKPNLKLSCEKRQYAIAAETELGFTWVATPRSDDFREEDSKDKSVLESWLGNTLEFASTQGKLKPGLVFEDFTWEAKGLRAPIAALPPQTFEQKGEFRTAGGQEGVVNFPIPYKQAPNVKLDLGGYNKTIVTDATPGGFRWKNTGADDNSNNASVGWIAVGIR